MRPVAYCDVDATARSVLHARIGDGSLPAAPVLGDVRDVTLESLPIRRSSHRLSVCAGFPCVGFSTAGRRRGFADPQSELFDQVLRLVDLLRSPVVLLENVAAILSGPGMQRVCRELHANRGYDLRWTVQTGFDVGAPQRRARWFCLATRPGLAWTSHRDAAPPEPQRWWARERGPRAECTTTLSDWYARVGLLGNSVIPQVLRRAFELLVSGYSIRPGRLRLVDHDTAVRQGSAVSVPRAKVAGGNRGGGPTWALHGMVHGRQYALPTALRGVIPTAPYHKGGRAQDPIVLDPAAFRSAVPPSALIRSGLVAAPIRLQAWATPRQSLNPASNHLTGRNQRDLPTQVRFETRTPAAQRECRVSPRFVEWLMGYPPDWTTTH
jgi:hypothetical protein